MKTTQQYIFGKLAAAATMMAETAEHIASSETHNSDATAGQSSSCVLELQAGIITVNLLVNIALDNGFLKEVPKETYDRIDAYLRKKLFAEVIQGNPPYVGALNL